MRPRASSTWFVATAVILASSLARTATAQPADASDARCGPPPAPARDSALRLGFAFGLDAGITGHLANAATGVAVGPELVLPIGPLLWHASLQLETVDEAGGYAGVRIDALGIGYPIEVRAHLPHGARLEVEPVLMNPIEVLGNDGHEILGSALVGAQATLLMERMYLTVLPAALELREWDLQGNGAATVATASSGLDYVFRASSGIRF